MPRQRRSRGQPRAQATRTTVDGDRGLLRAAEELHRNSTISDRTWAYLDARYDEKQMMDVVFTVGQYNLVSMALRSFRVPMDEGLEGFPE